MVVRTPPEVSLYHRFENDLFAALLSACAPPPWPASCSPWCCRGWPPSGRRWPRCRGLLVPEHAIDAQSLFAFADAVVSAGGTMNREAVALGTPVYTTFAGRMGAVDERLIAEGRLRPLTSAAELDLGPAHARAGPGTGAPGPPGAARTRA